MKVLIVKLSSMGDLVQLLPAVSDAARAQPGIRFDWVVDESFAEIPQWHPAVKKVVVSAHRRWRSNLITSVRSGEFLRFWRDLRDEPYDLVIDAQGSLKSALVTSMARGTKCGPDKDSMREYGAHWAYGKYCPMDNSILAVDRLRGLFSCALDYPLPESAPDFAIGREHWPTVEATPARPYLVFVTNASWSNKCWPDTHWQALLAKAGEDGWDVVLPWGNAEEHQRAQALARAGGDHVRVLPHLTLTELAGVLQRSAGAVCNDTGLAHIAAALDLPTVTLYGPTDPALIGATGRHSKHLLAEGFPCVPCYRRHCDWKDYKGPEAQCLKTLEAPMVWQALTEMQSAAGQDSHSVAVADPV